MNREDILKTVQLAIQEQLTDGKYNPGLPDASESLTSIGMDSYDILNVSFQLEEHYNIKIDDEELAMMTTVDDVVEAVASRL